MNRGAVLALSIYLFAGCGGGHSSLPVDANLHTDGPPVMIDAPPPMIDAPVSPIDAPPPMIDAPVAPVDAPPLTIDAAPADAMPPGCGDGIVQLGEQCDNGAANSDTTPDACRTNCMNHSCGDGVTDTGEGCDDGNTIDTDGCRNNCSLPTCGDGVIDPGEACDDGNADNTDACLTTCVLATCGDGFVQAGVEQCDGAGQTATCDADCTLAVCGDSIVNSAAGEVCDDGNTTNETACAYGVATCTGCSATCSAVLLLNGPTCGDGVVNGPEICDDGNTTTETACPYGIPACTLCNATCSAPLSLTGPYCGDGIVNAGETCDDGNTTTETSCPYGVVTCMTCDASCANLVLLSGPHCGDGVVNGPETCDDGNTITETSCPYGVGACAACDGSCSTVLLLTGPVCGDGVVNGPEICDDGNTTTETSCAYGVPACGGCNATCTTALSLTGPYCGDGIVNGGEPCDDGNADQQDDCLSSCDPASCSDGQWHDQGTGTETDVDCGGTTCAPCADGGMCNVNADCASGACVSGLCGPPAVIAQSPLDGAGSVDPSTTISITFNTAMDPATLTTQTVLGAPCSGNVWVTTDGGATCIPMATATPTMSGGGTIATFSAAPGLSFGETFQIGVGTGAQSTTGVGLAAPYVSAVGFTTKTAGLPCDNSVVISQVYGAGGNAGATYNHDFIELHNRGSVPVSLAGMSVQYAATTGTSWTMTALSGTIAAGGFVLVQESGGVNGAPLPTPDVIGTISMASSAGKVVLMGTATLIPSGTVCPAGALDIVGYGTGTTCSEGTPTLPLSVTNSAQRNVTACSDTNNNATDFTVTAVAPRNSATAATAACCVASTENESGNMLEADYCNVQFPTSLTITSGDTTTIYGRIYEGGVTEAAGASPLVTAQLGYGPRTSNPEWQAGWTWFDAIFNTQYGNNDEYMTSFTAPAPGDYSYAYRFSLDSGASWTYCDVDGAGSDAFPTLSFDTPQIPDLTVTP
jgi:cysteine-rich repeat protein